MSLQVQSLLMKVLLGNSLNVYLQELSEWIMADLYNILYICELSREGLYILINSYQLSAFWSEKPGT